MPEVTGSQKFQAYQQQTDINPNNESTNFYISTIAIAVTVAITFVVVVAITVAVAIAIAPSPSPLSSP
jgi:hypothetical protein